MMQNKIKVEDLEKLGQESKKKERSDDELFDIISNKEKLEKILKTERALFMSELFLHLTNSKEFKDRVDSTFANRSGDLI
jgi:hypothetical protein